MSSGEKVTRSTYCCALVFLTALLAPVSQRVLAQAVAPPPKIASLGRCKLDSGAIIYDCRLAYRSFGRANTARTNIVVVPTWLLGRSEDWLPLLGPTGIIDTTRFHVLVVDALADGLSSSPSNTVRDSRIAFDSLTISDMVVTQYQLLRDRLGLTQVHAIVGISMGGMQALEWAVRYPHFARRIVPIVGSPRVPAHDQLLWTAMLLEIQDAQRAGISSDTVWARVAQLEMLFLQTPGGLNARGSDSVRRDVTTNAALYRGGWALEDFAAHLRAISRHDISRPFGGDMERAAQAVRARTLAVYSWDDHMVTAGPMAEFARRIRADTLVLQSPCGHVTFFCDKTRIGTTVRAFLAQ